MNKDPLYRLPQRVAPRDPMDGTPQHLRRCVAQAKKTGGYPPSLLDFLMMLVDDHRMRKFWRWFETVSPQLPSPLNNSVVVGQLLWGATLMPSKPGNMTRKQRENYLECARHLAIRLRELLSATPFDPMWKDDKPPHLKTYRFGHRSPHIPRSALTELLNDLIDRTSNNRWEDTSRVFSVQTKPKTARAINFTCSVYQLFLRHGVRIPYRILATAGNVALRLEVHLLDEGTVGKQVRRCRSAASG